MLVQNKPSHEKFDDWIQVDLLESWLVGNYMPHDYIEYHMLRPMDLVRRREQMPVAYFGIGILEWHGLHNPLGLDGVKANGIACHLARELGGIVMPTQFWGDMRNEVAELAFDPKVNPWLPPNIPDQTYAIADLMHLDKKNFEIDAERSIKSGGWRLWKELMLQSMFEIETLGFDKIVLIPGHYPLFVPLRQVIKTYTESQGRCSVLMLTDHMFSEKGDSGDHAAMFETSLMMALYQDLVDISQLGGKIDELPIGVVGKDPRMFASRELGFEILAKFVSIVKSFIEEGKNHESMV